MGNASMLLAVDQGNSSVGLAAFAGRNLCANWRIATNAKLTDQEMTGKLAAICQSGPYQRILLGSVTPSRRGPLMEALSHFSSQVVQLPADGIPGAIPLVPDPSRVGIDRVLNCLASAGLHAAPAIVIDVGTAVTVDVASESGQYLGGVIAPGPTSFLKALSGSTELLPTVQFARPAQVLGRNTKESMQAGAYWGLVGLVRGLIGSVRSESGPINKVIATGGYCQLIADDVPEIDIADPLLTLRGIALAGERI